METIKLARRKALLLLNTQSCTVKIKGETGEFTTDGRVIDMGRHNNSILTTYIFGLGERLTCDKITHIKVGNRFNNIRSFMEIDWEEETNENA